MEVHLTHRKMQEFEYASRVLLSLGTSCPHVFPFPFKPWPPALPILPPTLLSLLFQTFLLYFTAQPLILLLRLSDMNIPFIFYFVILTL